MSGKVHRPEIVYLVRRYATDAAVVSTVIRPVALLHDQGVDIRLVILRSLREFLNARRKQRWRWLKEVLRAEVSGRACILPSPPVRLGAFGDAAVVGAWARWALGPDRHRVFHCSGPAATRVALELKRRRSETRVIYQMWGLLFAEHAYSLERQKEGGSGEAREIVSRALDLEKGAAQAADAVICVSQAMRDYVTREFDVAQEKVAVVPCCVESERFKRARSRRKAVRLELGLDDRLVVTYCGSYRHWQLPEECARVFLLLKQFEPSAHYLVLTSNPETMGRAVRDAGIGEADVTILCVEHAKVPEYLAASDIALLLRERSLVNEVASPVKFGEYMASGLPVVISEGVGDYSRLTDEERVGVVLPGDGQGPAAEECLGDLVADYRRDAESMRARCTALAERKLSWESHLDQITSLYEALAEP